MSTTLVAESMNWREKLYQSGIVSTGLFFCILSYGAVFNMALFQSLIKTLLVIGINLILTAVLLCFVGYSCIKLVEQVTFGKVTIDVGFENPLRK